MKIALTQILLQKFNQVKQKQDHFQHKKHGIKTCNRSRQRDI